MKPSDHKRYYATLGLAGDVKRFTPTEISDAYARCKAAWVWSHDSAKEPRLAELETAWQVLGDDKLRARYDGTFRSQKEIAVFKAAGGSVADRLVVCIERAGQWVGGIAKGRKSGFRTARDAREPSLTNPSAPIIAEEPFQLTEDMIVNEGSATHGVDAVAKKELGGKKIALITLSAVAAVAAGAAVYRKLNPPQKPPASWTAEIDASPAPASAAR